MHLFIATHLNFCKTLSLYSMICCMKSSIKIHDRQHFTISWTAEHKTYSDQLHRQAHVPLLRVIRTEPQYCMSIRLWSQFSAIFVELHRSLGSKIQPSSLCMKDRLRFPLICIILTTSITHAQLEGLNTAG